MNTTGMTRRGFGAVLGAAAGAMVLQRGFAPRAAEASIALGQPADAIQLNSNENPYGPSAAAREAAARSLDVAGRYPDSQEDELAAAVAKLTASRPSRSCSAAARATSCAWPPGRSSAPTGKWSWRSRRSRRCSPTTA